MVDGDRASSASTYGAANPLGNASTTASAPRAATAAGSSAS
jgi:hypothetical protein